MVVQIPRNYLKYLVTLRYVLISYFVEYVDGLLLSLLGLHVVAYLQTNTEGVLDRMLYEL